MLVPADSLCLPCAAADLKLPPFVLSVPQHYAWFYEGSQLRLQLMGLGMVALLLAGVMFPLWPPIMRQGVWYLSIGLLGLVGAFFVLAIIRLILWGLTTLVGKGWWLFPNLFADVGFVSTQRFSEA